MPVNYIIMRITCRRQKERKKGNTHLPSVNMLVVVFFSIHTQFGDKRFSSIRWFNWVVNRKAIDTNTYKANIFKC